jgi:excisionase family DNA binding protein
MFHFHVLNYRILYKTVVQITRGDLGKMLVGDLVTTKEAAELLRVSPWTVSAWLSQGKLRRVKAGGRTLIAKADLEAFVRRSSHAETSVQGVRQ